MPLIVVRVIPGVSFQYFDIGVIGKPQGSSELKIVLFGVEHDNTQKPIQEDNKINKKYERTEM